MRHVRSTIHAVHEKNTANFGLTKAFAEEGLGDCSLGSWLD